MMANLHVESTRATCAILCNSLMRIVIIYNNTWTVAVHRRDGSKFDNGYGRRTVQERVRVRKSHCSVPGTVKRISGNNCSFPETIQRREKVSFQCRAVRRVGSPVPWSLARVIFSNAFPLCFYKSCVHLSVQGAVHRTCHVGLWSQNLYRPMAITNHDSRHSLWPIPYHHHPSIKFYTLV